MLSKEVKAQLVKEFGNDEKDTGNVRVQIAILTKEIQNLTEHLKINIHDYASKRALFIKVGQRSGLLAYYDRLDHKAYTELIAKLGIRK